MTQPPESGPQPPQWEPAMPGWYDDPQDAQGQRYWDGQQWTPHHQRKPISQPPPPTGPPAQSAPPPPGVPPSTYQQAPWRPLGGGPPKKSWTPRVVAAVIGVVALLAAIGWLASPGTPSPSSTGHQDSPSAGHQDSPDGKDPTAGRSNSYRAGYWWAYQNSERMQSGVMINSAQTVCANTASSEAPVQGLNTQEWTQGCVDSWNKMGYGKSGPSSPGSIDCSKPGDGNDNGFHDINCPP